jgi:hypothetical protein
MAPSIKPSVISSDHWLSTISWRPATISLNPSPLFAISRSRSRFTKRSRITLVVPVITQWRSIMRVSLDSPNDTSGGLRVKRRRFAWSGRSASNGNTLDNRSTEKTLLFFCEQGHGDSIQFGRYLNPIKSQSPSCEITVCCHEGLKTLFQHSPADDVITETNGKDCDLWLPSFSAPLFFSDPGPKVFDGIEPFQIEATSPKIGICWQGNKAAIEDRWRSMPSPEILYPLRDCGTLINLQHNLKGDFAINPKIETFLDLAKVIKACDVVVSVDSSSRSSGGKSRSSNAPPVGLEVGGSLCSVKRSLLRSVSNASDHQARTDQQMEAGCRKGEK